MERRIDGLRHAVYAGAVQIAGIADNAVHVALLPHDLRQPLGKQEPHVTRRAEEARSVALDDCQAESVLFQRGEIIGDLSFGAGFIHPERLVDEHLRARRHRKPQE